MYRYMFENIRLWVFLISIFIHDQTLDFLSKMTFGRLIHPEYNFLANLYHMFWRETFTRIEIFQNHITLFCWLLMLTKQAYFADIFSHFIVKDEFGPITGHERQ
jgi:hypothetical protein